MRFQSLHKALLTVVATCFLASSAFASTEVAFSISGMDPVNVMRFQKAGEESYRIGYIQSTEFSHTVREGSNITETVEDGIIYYSVILERLEDGSFQMDISYDFSSPDGRSEGIRNRSVVSQDALKSITNAQLKERAKQHADEFAKVIFEYFLKYKLEEEVQGSLRVFLTEIVEDLLKSLPRDGVMIIRRWNDLSGARGVS